MSKLRMVIVSQDFHSNPRKYQQDGWMLRPDSVAHPKDIRLKMTAETPRLGRMASLTVQS